MTIIIVDNASFCPGLAIAETLAGKRGGALVRDIEIYTDAAMALKMDTETFERSIFGPEKPFGGMKNSRPKCVATLRKVLAERLKTDNSVVHGAMGYLIPSEITHVLKVGLVGSVAHRLSEAEKAGLPPKKAEQALHRDDAARAAWATFNTGRQPWDPALFDVLLPAHQLTAAEMIDEISMHADNPAVAVTEASLSALKDFEHAAAVQSVFAEKGHDVDVESREGVVKVLIRKHTLFLQRLKEQLVDIAEHLPGVTSASAHPGPQYQEANLYLDVRSELPAKVLLVDDEKSFVQTLSKRLQNRAIHSTVACGGAEALIRVNQEEPDVMVLDLKMPGVDGIEVLRTVKANTPKTEVIILTAHGSEAEERLVYQMGAFAYLRKPVDIDELTETMKRAYLKVKQNDAEDR